MSQIIETHDFMWNTWKIIMQQITMTFRLHNENNIIKYTLKNLVNTLFKLKSIFSPSFL